MSRAQHTAVSRAQHDALVRIGEAAQLCHKSTDTIRRHVLDGTIVGAHREGDRANAAWLIPVSGLSRAGYLPRTAASPDDEVDPHPPVLARPANELRSPTASEASEHARDERHILEVRLAEAAGQIQAERARADGLALLVEALREQIETLRGLLESSDPSTLDSDQAARPMADRRQDLRSLRGNSAPRRPHKVAKPIGDATSRTGTAVS